MVICKLLEALLEGFIYIIDIRRGTGTYGNYITIKGIYRYYRVYCTLGITNYIG